MSLHNLATQMAAQGRGPDRTLVHMSPREVQGLQALAMAHGGSLTINPETGLPEAGFLESILPAVAGFALNAFAPGVGTAVGGLFGLGEAAGTALTVGGIAGLTSGSLEKGIMAGMGAYGGAGLGASLQNSGTSALTQAGVDAAGGAAALGGDASAIQDTVAKASAFDKIKAGAGAAFSQPKDFLQDNKMNLALLAAPLLMDSFGNKDSGPEANPSPGYIRTMKRDPVTGRIYQESAIPTGEFGNRSVGTYGGVPARGMADGGTVDENAQVAYDTRTDSQKALDYLMGKPGSTNPMIFTRTTPKGPIQPADMLTRTGGRYVLDAATNTYVWVPDAASGGGDVGAAKYGLAGLQERLMPGKGDGDSSNPGWDAMTDAQKAGYYAENPTMGKITQFGQTLFGLTPLANLQTQEFRNRQALIAQGIDPDGPISLSGLPAFKEALHPESEGDMNTDTSPTVSTPLGDAPLSGGPPTGGKPGESAVGGTGYGFSGPTNNSIDGGWGSRDAGGGGSGEGGLGEGSGGGRYAAAGGLMEARYASGGLGSLGGYSDGGQLLRGPGDGVSDGIPARIGRNQPARLADGEFVIPARIVSELGNGSTNAGAKQLYKMLDRIQANRKKTVGKNKTATDSKSARYLPA